MARLIAPLVLLATLAICWLWQPHDPDAIDLVGRFAAPSLLHLLGTDQLGRDLLSRLMVGGWRTGAVLVIVTAIGLVGGGAVGLAAAIAGSAGSPLLRAAELFIAVPTLVVAIVAAALFGLSPVSAGVALGLAGVGPYALLIHSLAMRTMSLPYVLAARALGVSNPAILARHVLPDILPVVATHVGSNAGVAVVAYASLAFLGIGADPSKPDWGTMLFEYRSFLFDHVHLILVPGAAIALTGLCLNLSFDDDRHGMAPSTWWIGSK
jgi:peptide/nickel transport system permease protein